MKYASTFNMLFAFAAMLVAIYNHDINLAGAWSSAVIGWLIISAKSWAAKQ